MKKTHGKKQIRIGRERYINEQTGEVQEFDVIEQTDKDFNFDKLWLGHILNSLDIIGNKKIKVLNWLLSNKNAQNQILGTQREIAEKTDVSGPIVNETMGMLIQSNLLKKVRNGLYMLNPDVLFKGGNNQRLNVLMKYKQISEFDEKGNKIEEQKKLGRGDNNGA